MKAPRPKSWTPPRWTPTIHQDEPSHGLYLRLCDLNGIARTETMAALTGVRVSNVRRGLDLSGLARISYCPLQDLQGSAYRGGAGNQVVVRGEYVDLGCEIDTTFRRFCPECLDESPYHRFWWDLTFIQTCPRHRCHLSQHCQCGERLTWKSGVLRGCENCASDNCSSPIGAPVELVAVDAWILSRFASDAEGDFGDPLNDLSLPQALDLLERLGTVQMLGRDDPYAAISELGVNSFQLRAHGYKTFRQFQLNESLLSAGISPERWVYKRLTESEYFRSDEFKLEESENYKSNSLNFSLKSYLISKASKKIVNKIQSSQIVCYQGGSVDANHIRPFSVGEPDLKNGISPFVHSLMTSTVLRPHP